MEPNVARMFFLLLFITMSSSLDLPVCDPPGLCEEERGKVVFAHVGDNFTFNICIKSNGFLTLYEVFPTTRYTTSILLEPGAHSCHHSYSNITVYNVQKSHFGPMTFEFTPTGRKASTIGFNYEILLLKKDFDFRAEGSSPSHFKISESLTLKCKTEGLSSSSLSIVKENNKSFLKTKVISGSLVYTIESLQCQDMGTYLCLYNKDTSQNVTIDVHVATCMTFTAAGPSGFNYSVSDNISLVCESSDYAPSELSISLKDGRQRLKTNIMNNTLVYGLHDIQCTDMATYICHHTSDSSYNATLDLPILNCPPQLCHKETKTRTIFATVNDNVSFDICVISLDSIFQNRNSTEKLVDRKYGSNSTSTTASQRLYPNVNFVLQDIQKTDFGNLSINLTDYNYRSLIYEIILADKDFDFKAEGSSPPPFNISENLTLKCKTEGLSSSSLSIVKRGNNQSLRTELMNGSLVYTIESLQCQDMGTYLCLYDKDTSQNVTLDVHVATCFTFKASRKLGSIFPYNPLNITCESRDYPPSSLSIVMKDRNKTLPTEVVNETLVYHIDRLQCQDMGTYMCLYGEDTTQSTFLDLPIRLCAPRLCIEGNQPRVVNVEINSDLHISICVISHDAFFLERIFLDGREARLLGKYRYKPYNSSEIAGEYLYHSVDIEMYNITEEDFGKVTIRLRHVSVLGLRLDYESNLQQTTHTGEYLHEIDRNPANESTRNISTLPQPEQGNSSMHEGHTVSTGDSFMIYVVSGVCTFVALLLVGTFIYFKIRVKKYRNDGNHLAQTNPDVHCVLLNYLPKHGVDDSTGGVKQIHDNSLRTTSFHNVGVNGDANDEDGRDDMNEELEDETQLPGYHIYDVVV